MSARGKSGVEVFDVTALRGGIVAWGNGIRDAAEKALESVADDAANDMRVAMISATTPTGEDRARAGGIAGRYDTGQMHDDVEAKVFRDGKDIVLRWGWLSRFQAYYGFQERGTKHIEAMNALGGSYVRTQDRLWDRLAKIARGR